MVSWNAMSNPAFDKITPVTPPIVNKTINPKFIIPPVLKNLYRQLTKKIENKKTPSFIYQNGSKHNWAFLNAFTYYYSIIKNELL